MTLAEKISKTGRQATNVTISKDLLDDARKLKVNISQAAERGLERANAEKRSALWLEENCQAIESSNQYVERQGLPLAKYREF
ncbi:type II toxin-antitoxin system CcdA family antitoxin [Pelovirga terrestris]|uniref:Type II toxin-antitoxin system CcdA family antitoxin n=1 Tax=Pelovirga terrestris TaxID=2771352 RepID=A0A8J6R4P2_9BACT|nr:type II toxin-antitoxin system CcdA family antitoxin [Pelovirga terrestris]MBD1399414.1 type II toxin-antitoxin system CcdA family antitoxin [Pelovirga terrestris]